MNDKIIVSIDEEKLMNDILDKGIDELKNYNHFPKIKSLGKSININNGNEFKSQNNIKNSNNQINYKQNLPHENYKNNENLYQAYEPEKQSNSNLVNNNTNKINSQKFEKTNFIKSNLHDSIENRFKEDLYAKANEYKESSILINNPKRNLDNLKLNKNTPEEKDCIANKNLNFFDDKSNNFHENSNLPETKRINLQDFNSDETLNLPNNQSIKNNLLNSNVISNDKQPIAKSSALKALLEEMKNNNKYLNESNENLLFGLSSKGNNLKTVKNNSSINDINGNMCSNPNIVLDSNKMIRSNSSNNLLGNKCRNISVDSLDSKSDLNFDEMKNEIDNLQSKIDGLEKRLFENCCSQESFDLNFNTKKASDGIRISKRNKESDILNTSKIKSLRNSTSKNKLNTSIKSSKSYDFNKSLNENNYDSNENYRKKYTQKNHFSRSRIMNDSDYVNINSSQEFSCDKFFKNKNNKISRSPTGNRRTNKNNNLSEKEEKNSDYGNKKTEFLQRRTLSNINFGEYNINRISSYSKKNEINHNVSEDNKSENDEPNSKRISKIVEKTKDILGRSVSNKKSKANELDEKIDKVKKEMDRNIVQSEKSDIKIIIDTEIIENSDFESIKPKYFNMSKTKKRRSKRKYLTESKIELNYNKENFHLNSENLNKIRNSNSKNHSNLKINDSTSKISIKKKKNSNQNFSNISYSKRISTGNNASFSVYNYSNKSKLTETDKEKIIKLKEKNNELRVTLKNERKKVDELEKKTKRNKFKEENFDKLETTMIDLEKQYEKLMKNYNQSELIRKEQAKLIKSMQYEIELLREGKSKE